MKKALTLFALLLFTCNFLLAQTIRVVDKSTLQPLIGVVISIEDKVSVQTNSKGQADIATQLHNEDIINLNYTGYQSLSLSVEQLKKLNYRVLLTQMTYNLNEVVVSVGKFSEQQKLVPQQVEVLNKKELAFLSQPTTADVLQHSGKVLVQKSQLGGGSPIIRGFEANKVLLVIDGVRMNNAIYRGGHLQNVISLDNSILERTEVIFGPSSVIYGSDALGGVLHFHTSQPELSDPDKISHTSGGAFTRYGTAANEKTVHAQLNYGRRKWASLTSITATDFGNLRQGANRKGSYGDLGIRKFYAARIADRDTMLANPNSNVQRHTGYTQVDVLQKVLFKPSDHISHTLNLQLSTSTDVPRYDRLTEFSGNKLKFAEWYYGPQNRLMAAYTLADTRKTNLYDENKLTTAYQWLEESRHNRRFSKNTLSHQIEQVQVYSINADLTKRLNQHRLQYGLEANYNKVNSEANNENVLTGISKPRSTRYPDGGSSMHTAAGYLTHTWDIKPWLILNQGLRYTYTGLDAQFNDKTFFPFLIDQVEQRNHAISGNIGTVILPGNGWRFTLLGSTGFRSPNVDDLSKVFDSTPGTVIVPNPALRPEYTYNIEASASKSIKERLHVELVGFRTWYRNAITTQPFLLNGRDSIQYEGSLSRVTASVNADQAYVYGYSASLKADITKAISLSSALNYTYGRILQNEGDIPLDHVPPLFGRTSINLQAKRLRAEFFILYNGEKAIKDYNPNGEDNQQYATPQGMPAWHTFNLRTAYQITPHLQVQAALENITDRYYRVFASGISAPGRNFVFTVRGKF